MLKTLEQEAERFGLAPPYVVEVEEFTHREDERPHIMNVHSIMTGLVDGIVGAEGEGGIEIRCGFDSETLKE